MSEHNARNRKIAIAVVAGLALGGGGAAYAYWSSTGTGSGEATTGVSTAFSVTTSPVSGAELTPGGPSQSVAFTVTNPSTGSQTLSSVVVTVANADGSTWSVDDCSAADYTVSSLISYGVIAGGGAASGSVTIAMVNAPTNQDDCQGVDVPLYIEAG